MGGGVFTHPCNVRLYWFMGPLLDMLTVLLVDLNIEKLGLCFNASFKIEKL